MTDAPGGSTLHEFITAHRSEIITRCRRSVAVRSIPPPTRQEIEHGVPLFLDQLVDVLRRGTQGLEIDLSAGQHGRHLLAQGFTLSQVVHDYGDVCQTITGLAVEKSAPIRSEDFQTLNACLDDAIASAVTHYARESQRLAVAQQQAEIWRSQERIGFVVHELRNLVNTAIVAFEILKTSKSGISGSTGAVVARSLHGLRDLVSQSLDEVRLTKGTTYRERIAVGTFVDEIGEAARLTAQDRGVTLDVPAVAHDVMVEADPQVLRAVVMNLLQNAFKFTQPGSHVSMRACASADRVLIEVEDECGGLVGESVGDVSPRLEQRGKNRSGLGIGLAFSRWGAEASGGRLYARNLPGKGCVFIVNLPRADPPAPLPSIVQHDAQQGAVDLQPAVVLDES